MLLTLELGQTNAPGDRDLMQTAEEQHVSQSSAASDE